MCSSSILLTSARLGRWQSSAHQNSGYRVKNLRETTGCTCYRQYQASADSTTKCAVNGCSMSAIRACHVIAANQSAASGTRKIVYMCASHNGVYTKVLDIRSNALTYDLPGCTHGTGDSVTDAMGKYR